MSRRLQQYKQFRRDTVDETTSAILHAHRLTSRVSKRIEKDDEGKIVRGFHSSMPINPEKAQRLAAGLHRKKV